MAKPNWTPKLENVLMRKTVQKTMVSEKTGNNYNVEVIENLRVISTGNVEMTNDGKFKYSIVDIDKGLEYEIKADNQINIKFGTILEFINVRGGVLSNGNGWYRADSVRLIQKNGQI